MNEWNWKHHVLLAICSTIFLALLSLLYRRRLRLRLPPGPLSLPVIGHLHLIKPPLHHFLHSLAAGYGPLLRLRLGSTLCIVASSPDIAMEFLKTHEAAFSSRPQSAAARHFAYGSAGFASAPYGPYYSFMRRLCMSELLSIRTIDRLRPIRRRELLQLLKSLQSKSTVREPVDLTQELIKATNNAILRMAAGTVSSDTEEIMALVKQATELVVTFNLADHVWLCRHLDLQGLNRRIREVRQRFDALMERIIEAKKTRRATGCGVKDLLDILLDAAEDETAEMKLSMEQIKGFFMDIVTAGSDSSATTVEWALAELINHPDHLVRLRQEIKQVVGMRRVVDESDMGSLPFIQAVVKETLRLHPPGPLIYRKSSEDVRVRDYEIPAGTTLIVNVWAVGRDGGHWGEPEEFRPERFVAGGEAAEVDVRGQQFQMLPFGSGRRGCPGMMLALQVVPVTLAAMVQCFEWEVEGGAVDMEEGGGGGLVVGRSQPLVCVPVDRMVPLE